jgi:hypothetical protein
MVFKTGDGAMKGFRQFGNMVNIHNFDGRFAGFPPRRLRFDSRSGNMGFMLNKVALEQVFSAYFGFS